VRRRLFNLAAAVSLVLCLATATMWVRSLHHSDALIYDWPSGQLSLSSSRGFLCLVNVHSPSRTLFTRNPPGLHGNEYDAGAAEFWSLLNSPSARGLFSFRWNSISWTGGAVRETDVLVPHSWVLIALLLLPVWWSVRFRRNRRKRAGTCPHCGYDLRATPDRCPECGTTATPSPA